VSLIAEDPNQANEAHRRSMDYVFRLEDSVLKRGRGLLTIWNSSNTPDNPLRALPGPDGKAVSINLMMSACLHETILITCAVLDSPKPNRALLKSNLISFPVIAGLMQIPGTEKLRLADGDEAIKLAAQPRFFEHIDSLKQEPMKARITRLRGFRDEFLAHALDQDWSKTPPALGDITALMDLACIMSGDCQLALFAKRVSLRPELMTVSESIEAVWRMLARRGDSAGHASARDF
jgi:hypothetical protein